MTEALLFGGLPEGIFLGEKYYRIFTGFKTWMQVETVLFDKKGEFYTKLPELLRLCYPVLPDSLGEAVLGIATFYRGENSEDTLSEGKHKKKRLYSFKQDAALIYAGFYQQYGIDLTRADLHWFQFKALFEGLSENTQFSRVVGYRAVDISACKSEEKRRFYYTMKSLYRLKDHRTEEERERDAAVALSSLF